MARALVTRRSFVTACGGLLLSQGLGAQPPGGVRKIGVVANHIPRKYLELGPASPDSSIRAFVKALNEAGWQEGRDVQFIWRSAEGRMDRHPAIASELVRMPVDLLVGGDDAMVAASRATRTIPIVAYAMYNPVENRFAASFARPGGNITGIANSAGAELQKALALLKESSPRIHAVALVAQAYDDADHFPQLRPDHSLAKAGAALGLDLFFMTWSA